jgi:hypothetical protein
MRKNNHASIDDSEGAYRDITGQIDTTSWRKQTKRIAIEARMIITLNDRQPTDARIRMGISVYAKALEFGQ